MRNMDVSHPREVKADACSIVPGLPDDLAQICLAFIPLCHHSRLKVICKAWRAAFSSNFLLKIRRQWKKTEEFLCIFRNDPSVICGEVFDPRSEAWTLLPPMPCDFSTYGLSNFHCASVGMELFVIGGSLFDARSYPVEKPLASSAVFKYDPSCGRWGRLSNMKVARGSFACGVSDDFVIVAGGSSRHVTLPSDGDRVSSVERYETKDNEWHAVEGLRNIRAGCEGFLYQGEFWVLGGYGHSRTIAGVLPADEHYRDGEILDLKTGTWRYLKPMWKEGERRQLGMVAVINADDFSGIFMLENFFIYRYNITDNVWIHESKIPRKSPGNVSSRLVALGGELYVFSVDDSYLFTTSSPARRSRLFFQIYDPKKKSWRFMSTQTRQRNSPGLPWVSFCTLRL